MKEPSANPYHSFYDDGFIKLESVLESEQLARVQEEFYRVETAGRPDWRRQVSEGLDYKAYGMGETAHVVFPIAPHGDIFVDLLEHSKTIAVAEAFLGPDLQMIDNALHVKPAGSKSHTVWHQDAPTWEYLEASDWSTDDWRLWEGLRACERPFHKIKIFFFVEDITEDTAPFSVVAGSHKFPEEARDQACDDLTSMPDHGPADGQGGRRHPLERSHLAHGNGQHRCQSTPDAPLQLHSLRHETAPPLCSDGRISREAREPVSFLSSAFRTGTLGPIISLDAELPVFRSLVYGPS